MATTDAPPTTSLPVTTTSTTEAPPPAEVPALAALVIVDGPTRSDYRREDWPTWKDVDNDGCDARSQALLAASNPPAQAVGCNVVSGTWSSAYDGQVLTSPADIDVDHVVPLENAHQSGGWAWSTDRRAAFANDQASLWAVSKGSNRSKGSRSPDAWRPPNRDIWCQYASRWLSIKVRWELTATTLERDALGQMLDTCGDPDTAVDTTPRPLPAPPLPPVTTAVVPIVPVAPALDENAYYANCAAVRAAGAAPLLRGQPGYRRGLDRDGDGVACE